jgi:YegS/Rv2252/BmrU family lipid kinase
MPIACLLFNPVAGRFPSRLLTERAGRVLMEYGWQIYVEQTRGGDHTTELAQKAASENLDALFVAGGDGSIGKAAAGLVGSNTALGVLPAGTANVWAQEFGLPGLNWTKLDALEECAHKLGSGTIKAVDVGVCNGTPFMLWAGIGLDAFVVHQLEPRKRWEKHFAVPKYAASIVKSARIWDGMSLELSTEGKVFHNDLLLAVVSNIRRYAGGLAKLSPYAYLDDGVMELWMFKGESLKDAVFHALNLLSGRHVKSDQVHALPFTSLTLRSKVPLFLQLDGDPIDPSTAIEIEVKQQALKVLVPQSIPEELFSTE